MKRNEFLALLGTIALGGGLLSGCALEGDACTSDSDCGAFKCDLSAPNEEGQGTCFTECTTNSECSVGNACVAGSCEPSSGPVPGQCNSDAECGNYRCEANQCLDACVDGSECSDGAQCTNGSCEVAIVADPYTFVAVLSEVPITSADVENTTPGPDVDAVELRQGTASFYAASIARSNMGSQPAGRTNNYTNFNNALGAPNAHTGNGPQYQCDVETQNYVSLGANDGFMVVSFDGGTEIVTGNTVRVWELESNTCSNRLPDRADVYSVWIGQANDAATADAIRLTWCGLGTSPGAKGGVVDFNVNIDTCP
jgi:hypothetical protein